MIHMIFYAPIPQIVPLIKQVFQERPDCDELEYEIVQDFYNNPLPGFERRCRDRPRLLCPGP